METNEIYMFMDAKLDIHSKRPESLKFKTWSRCLVKIEAVKCLPSFLRVSLTRCSQVGGDQVDPEISELQSPVAATLDVTEPPFNVSINVPGVNVSQTESRTKPHSYGLFWRQHRRDCFIYFAIETESSFRRHMKWIKKSIKNLELHRQVFLELRRNSRGSSGVGIKAGPGLDQKNANGATKSAAEAVNALGPLPKIPDANVSVAWSSGRVSRVSEIYEEILEHDSQAPRLSRRYSRTSIASGIYEEMKPTPAVNFNAIVEEVFIDPTPPPVPPLPPRKRINTFGAEAGLLGDVRRSSTNPESDMAKKKKYKNMLKNTIFGGVGRSKRAASVSETVACSVDELLNDGPAVYENQEAPVADDGHRQQQTPKPRAEQQLTAQSKRNSFSSPDLSKINFIDTFDGELVHNSFTNRDDFSESLDEASVQRIVGADDPSSDTPITMLPKEGSHESLNISEQIPVNFNFSACNLSTINLVGASGASLVQSAQNTNKILIEDLTGYCVMAPIPTKKQEPDAQQPTLSAPQSTQPASTLSSGYSTGGSHYSSTSSSAASSCINSTEHKIAPPIGDDPPEGGAETEGTTALAEESGGIYEQMIFGNNSLNSPAAAAALYENILTIKAAQELAAEALPATPPAKISTSTPTGDRDGEAEIEENFYQTPRRSIISVDEKVPSYYPNSCDNNKMRRSGQSPNKCATTPTSDVSLTAAAIVAAASSISLRQAVSAKLCHERKENFYISSPQKTIKDQSLELNQNQASKSNKSKKTAAHKISEHVYNVSHAHNKKAQKCNKSPSVNDAIAQAKLQRELLQLVALQNIDFKFDEPVFKQMTPKTAPSAKQQEELVKEEDEAGREAETEDEDENCFKAKENKLKSTKILQKLTTATRTTSTLKSPTAAGAPTITVEPAPSHHLQQSQQVNLQQQQQLSPKEQEAFVASNQGSGKKFASLPRFKKIDFSPLKLKISNVLQRSNHQQQQQQIQQQQPS